ncbi:flavin monoamine oxidase family protein [Robertkochia flava]|uniref:flavin monoamine oxidase family protein n=1 Tax=Robertkochia flava TaxID=3447986 RepID=UPI001CCFB237|nr:FAD-dependent oxidoreductase [Robertkochia marina]
MDNNINDRIQADIVIIGAGLTGLSLNYFLRNSGLRVCIVEARERAGGRICTVKEKNEPTVEMGATWFGPKHQNLVALLRELKLEAFPQHMGTTAIYEYMSTSPPQMVRLPENEEPTYRIRGGTHVLINTLMQYLEKDTLFNGREVRDIKTENGQVRITTGKETFVAKKVVSTLPPHLFLNKIQTDPPVPENMRELMGLTHTWMGESIKFGLTYKTPFWKREGSSGTVFSNTGPVTEMYDHSDFEDEHYALKGFLNGVYYSLSKEERLEMILAQLRRYYGKSADTYTNYHECVWTKEAFTHSPYERHVLPHQNNGHPEYRQPLMSGKLYLAGSETASQFPGYMDGAVESAKWVYQQLCDSL